MNTLHFVLLSFLFVSCAAPSETKPDSEPILENERLLTFVADPYKDNLRFYWKMADGTRYGSLSQLRETMSNGGDSLIFAVNGGMYDKSYRPQGLYVETGNVLSPLDTVSKGYGNFYLQPNGIFGLHVDGTPFISATDSLELTPYVQYATQSGPMLVIDGDLHPAFNEGSPNVNIRNGVGLLPDGRLLFVMSKEKINFFDFASFFRDNGCANALYLDGFVSRTWLPAQNWRQADGDFGVIIAVTSPK